MPATQTSQRLFCSRPFKDIDVTGFRNFKGDVYLCCSAWLPRVVGNVQRHGMEEIWNGAAAQEVRRSILDGSFRFCSESRCPFLRTVSGPVKPADEVEDPRLRQALDEDLTRLPWGPLEVNCSYDRSCNLACPSCRAEPVVESAQEEQILNLQQKLEAQALKDAEYLYITGSGDAFGSPFFNRWLRTMDLERMPRLRTIHLHTNGQLWTPAMWSRIPRPVRQRVRSAEISIDAASPKTYALNRPPGSFPRLLENLEFIAGLRRRGPLAYLKLSMVVQRNNFREMPEFARLGERYGADVVLFTKLVNWGTFRHAEYRRRAVHLPQHPEHEDFQEVLEDDVLRHPRVSLGNLPKGERALVG